MRQCKSIKLFIYCCFTSIEINCKKIVWLAYWLKRSCVTVSVGQMKAHADQILAKATENSNEIPSKCKENMRQMRFGAIQLIWSKAEQLWGQMHIICLHQHRNITNSHSQSLYVRVPLNPPKWSNCFAHF